MEPADENSATSPGNGEPQLPGDDQQNLGLGFDSDPDKEDEVLYEKRLSEEFEDLVLGEQRSERDRLVDQGEGFNGGKNNKGYNGNISYPVRPDAEDCAYYMRNGSCKFGSSCKFNHPLKRRIQYPKAPKDREGYSERIGQIECKYQMSSGGCKLGQACKYSHSRTRTPAPPTTPINFLGLPIRPGATECSFYMRNGSCKYGSSCKFNHPEPTAAPGANSPSGYVNGGTVSLPAVPQKVIPQWSSPGASPGAINGNGYVLPVMYSPTHGVPASNLDWNNYQAPVYPATERRLPTPPAFTLSNPTETNFYSHQGPPMLLDDFPERPGEPECNYYIKTGDCKYRSSCKFHHPKNRTKSTQCTFSDKGLPLRPDEKICSYYTRYGICKYGPSCRYDHPVNYDNSASSSGSRQNHAPFFGNSGAANGGKNDDDNNAVMYQNG